VQEGHYRTIDRIQDDVPVLRTVHVVAQTMNVNVAEYQEGHGMSGMLWNLRNAIKNFTTALFSVHDKTQSIC